MLFKQVESRKRSLECEDGSVHFKRQKIHHKIQDDEGFIAI